MGCPQAPPTRLEMAAGCSSSPRRPPHSFSLASPFLPVAAEILQANDNLTQVINLYKQLVRGEEVNGDATAACIPGEEVAGELGGPPSLRGMGSRVGCWSQSLVAP